MRRQLIRGAGGQRLDQVVGRGGAGHLPLLAETVDGAEHFRRGQAALGQRQRPVVLAANQHGHQVLAAPRAQRGAAEQAERHVGAQIGGQAEQFVVGQRQLEELARRQQRGRRVRRSPGHATGDGDGLVDVDRRHPRHLRLRGFDGGDDRPPRQIRFIGGHVLRRVPRHRQPRHVSRGVTPEHLRQSDGGRQRQRLEDRDQLMETVRAHIAAAEVQVDLGMRGRGHGQRRPAVRRRRDGARRGRRLRGVGRVHAVRVYPRATPPLPSRSRHRTAAPGSRSTSWRSGR